MSTLTSPATADLARRFQALADEKRLAILEILRAGEHCVCDLVDHLDVSQSLLSFHLRTLKDAGLVRDRREGRWVHYAAVPGALEELEGALAAFREDAEAMEGRTPRCCG